MFSLQKVLLSSVLLLALAMDPTHAENRNCSSVIKIKSKGLLNYLADVSFKAPKAIQGPWTIQMETDVPFTFLGGWGVWINVDEEEGRATIRSKDTGKFAKDDLISFRFRISWFLNEPKPFVVLLKWEGITICEPTEGTTESIRASKRKRYDEIRANNKRTRMRVN